mgnify:CR=1 FL=1
MCIRDRPDLALTSRDNVLEDLRRIKGIVDLPILVDCDTGWGSGLNISKTIKEMITAGADAVHLEDQVSEKRCGHRPGKEIVSTEEMVDRIKASKDSVTKNDFMLMARTDAFSKEGINSVIDRSNAFIEAGEDTIKLYNDGLKIEIKEDGSPVSNGDLKANDIISKKISSLTPNIPIISEETVNLNEKNKSKIFWLIDPIDGTKEYIAGKDEYTLNAALVINTVPVLGLVGVPKKKRLFFSYSPGESYLIEENITKKISCKKQQPKGKVVALSSVIKPSDIILNKLKQFNVTSIVKMASSYKFCVIATGEYDIYAASERANEWDYAAGHAVAQNAGAIIKTLDLSLIHI